ncbi:unnamed protein product [Caenorhabditis brenneri]
MTASKPKRLQEFLAWCVERVKVFTKPMTKGFLSKEYVRLHNPELIPYYFSVNYTDAYMIKGIKISNHSLEDQAKLMCLFSLPVDAEFFKILIQFANIELDGYMRITHYEHGTTVFGGTHKKPRAEKKKKKATSEENGQDLNGGLDEDDDIIVEDEDFDEIEILDSSTFKTPSNQTTNQSVEETIHNLFNNVSSTSQWMGADSTQPTSSASFLPPPNSSSNQNWSDLLSSKTQNQSGLEVPKELTPNSTITMKDFAPERSALMDVIQKLELFFLYKCRQDLMPLCLRIKEFKENEANFSQKNIQASTIKSFFEVPIRLMVVRNVIDLVKMEHSTRDFKIGVNEFLEDLKSHNIVEGLREVIENIQGGVANRETISYQTICFTFIDIVNNLAEIC